MQRLRAGHAAMRIEYPERQPAFPKIERPALVRREIDKRKSCGRRARDVEAVGVDVDGAAVRAALLVERPRLARAQPPRDEDEDDGEGERARET